MGGWKPPLQNGLISMTRFICVALIGVVTNGLRSAEAPVMAAIETTLSSAAPQIKMFAFDGDANTYFLSSQNAAAADHFTLLFDAPVALKSVAVLTGRVKGGDALDAGVLELSEDGKTFEGAAKFADGAVKFEAQGKKVRGVRIKPSEDLKHPLAIREFTLVSTPEVKAFEYPVEVYTDTKDDPELTEWIEKTARICERAYQMICEELKSDGFTPKTVVRMTLKNDYKGVAATGGLQITGAVKYFKTHRDDAGAMVHEMVHVAQQYHSRNNPSWLVEGVADYIRNYKYEPEKKMRPVNPDAVKYDGSYQISARFLKFLSDKYDPEIVSKLNKIMRDGKYNENVFEELTKKKLPELDAEWKTELRKK